MRIGDVAVIAGEPVELPNGRVVSRSMDNRLGCFVALEAARLVAEAGGAPGDVFAVAVAQEEITFGGARTTAYSLQPDVAIVVDVTLRDRRARASTRRSSAATASAPGPVIDARLDAPPAGVRAAARGRRGRGHPVHGRGLARAPPAPTRTRSTSSRAGIPTGVVSIPLRYMHSPVEMVQLDDVRQRGAADRRVRAAAEARTLDFRR